MVKVVTAIASTQLLLALAFFLTLLTYGVLAAMGVATGPVDEVLLISVGALAGLAKQNQ